jgi:Ca-activated chloride channel family protein
VVTLALLLAACSSAGDVLSVENSGTTSAPDSSASAGPNDTIASSSSDPASGEADGGQETGVASGEAGSSDSGEPSDPPQDPIPAEPSPEDVIDAKGLVIDEDVCDLQTPVSIELRTLDAAATVSPTQARDAALSGWSSLTGIRIRPWEFFNYYAFDYPAAEPGSVTITPQLALAPAQVDAASPEFLLQIGVGTQALAAAARPPMRLTLALDNSNSMTGKAQDMLHATGKALAANLREGDTLSIVTWNSKYPTVLELHAITGPGDPVVLEKLDALELGGSAELYSGLMSAYKLAVAGYDPLAWNRVLLVSDGGATANDTDLAVIRKHAEQQIYLSGVGVGEAGIYRSDMIDAAAHAGRGASMFVGSEAEADKRFGPQLVRTLGTAVRDVSAHLELPPGFQVVRDPGGLNEFNADDPSVRLGPNASLVLHRRLRSCNPDAASDPEAKLLVRVTFIDEATGELKEAKSAVKLSTLLADKPAALAKGAALAAYAAALQRWQARPADLAEALTEAKERLKAAMDLLPNDPELAEISAVLDVLDAG